MANHPDQSVYRILDASLNRANEGIRTIEEFVRFSKDDRVRAGELKDLRHRLQSAASGLDRRELLLARDTEHDVGTQIEARHEYTRPSSVDVVVAAAERVQQAFRVLEEYGKTIDPNFARGIESARYDAYTLFREIQLGLITNPRVARLESAALYFLIDCRRSTEDFVRMIRQLSSAGVDLFQLRDKTASDRQLFDRATIGVSVARECGSLFIVNDRADIAHACDADGVHVGQDELPVAAARRVVGGERIVGVSTHDMDQVRAACGDGADYIGCGPTFPSTTKIFPQQAGLAFLESVQAFGSRDQSTDGVPAFAIGGITLDNLESVLECGFDRIAVTAAIGEADDPIAAARRFSDRLGECRRV